ncbi:WhiB family transcriptional regulator [Kitasatospora paranensis]|uniref:WhiB family transcriptional regulator n=1 Tax=Kitasatospora paranensis TaxID=258053 RepID=A0ABW2G423_9ACTN
MCGDPNRTGNHPVPHSPGNSNPLPHWRQAAACVSEDPELFFPISNERPGITQTRRAKAVCAHCPVIATCAETAMTTG